MIVLEMVKLMTKLLLCIAKRKTTILHMSASLHNLSAFLLTNRRSEKVKLESTFSSARSTQKWTPKLGQGCRLTSVFMMNFSVVSRFVSDFLIIF
jgi:hypothetical protein